MGASGSAAESHSLPPPERLKAIVSSRGYLREAHHYLNPLVQQVQAALAGGDDDAAAELLNRLEKEVDVEQEALARAFRLFDNSGRGALNKGDMKNMNRYLGFPAEDADIDLMMSHIDTDSSGTVTFDEFDHYVGCVGGTPKLFEERHKRIMDRRSSSGLGEATTENIASSLNQAGIDQEAQMYWRMVVPGSEFAEAAKLVKCQKDAIATIRRLAKKNHQDALPQLQERVHDMGFKDDDLWLTLAWIRELAPIIVHIDLNKMLKFLEKDTHYRNQFETATSGGLLKPEVRKKWEKDLFAGCYDKADGFLRPKYGVQNVMNDHRGVIRCAQYGDSYLILKDARLRCTFAPEDSANLKAEKLAVLDFYAHVLNEYSDQELKETMKVANSADAAVLGDSDRVGKMKYKEAQIHGEVAFGRHIERLVVATKHRGDAGMQSRIASMCSHHGFDFSWMDEEQERLKSESMHRLGGSAWQARLQQLQDSDSAQGDILVAEGFCKNGCGRRVAPGVTRANRPFTTCCRGCVMGFGHDRLCGQIDASKVGPGLCKVGCGRKVAPGKDAKGRPFTTCCRGCVLGTGHDSFCQRVREAVPKGMCRMGCGRAVAAGLAPSGRPFDTCCKGCARGDGQHSATCVA